MTNNELFKRALWICRRAHTLHVLSYELGRNEHLAADGLMPAHVCQLRQFLEQADEVVALASRRRGLPRRRIQLKVVA